MTYSKAKRIYPKPEEISSENLYNYLHFLFQFWHIYVFIAIFLQ